MFHHRENFIVAAVIIAAMVGVDVYNGMALLDGVVKFATVYPLAVLGGYAIDFVLGMIFGSRR